MNDNKTFTYSYSATQQEEINMIRKKYFPQTDDKMTQLKKLDESVTKKGTRISVVLGTLGTLLLGIGMSCTMVWADKFFIIGIVIGIIGFAAISFAYPAFNIVTKKEKERIAPLIIKLTDELTKDLH